MDQDDRFNRMSEGTFHLGQIPHRNAIFAYCPVFSVAPSAANGEGEPEDNHYTKRCPRVKNNAERCLNMLQ